MAEPQSKGVPFDDLWNAILHDLGPNPWWTIQADEYIHRGVIQHIRAEQLGLKRDGRWLRIEMGPAADLAAKAGCTYVALDVPTTHGGIVEFKAMVLDWQPVIGRVVPVESTFLDRIVTALESFDEQLQSLERAPKSPTLLTGFLSELRDRDYLDEMRKQLKEAKDSADTLTTDPRYWSPLLPENAQVIGAWRVRD